MTQLESRNQKRKEFVDAIVIRKETVVLAACVFSIMTPLPKATR
jgi:hypothetical protein